MNHGSMAVVLFCKDTDIWDAIILNVLHIKDSIHGTDIVIGGIVDKTGG